MDYKGYEWRIALSLVVLLILIQLAGFFAMQRSNLAIALGAVETELDTASHVAQRVLSLRHAQLFQSAAVLASDFGLRETLATGDVPTIESMLDNHGRRIGADLVVLSGLDGRLLASVAQDSEHRLPPIDASRLLDAQGSVLIKSIDVEGRYAFQFVTVPVMTPRQTAWLTMGFAIDDDFAADLSELNGLQVSVLSRSASEAGQVLASTLSADHREDLMRDLPGTAGKSLWTGVLGGEDFRQLALPLSAAEGIELDLVLSVSLERAMAPYQRIEAVIGALIIVGLVLSGLAVQLVTRRLVAPLNAMAHLDSLTGVANRRLLDMALRQAELARQSRAIPYSLLIVDLDKFKELNDTHGHAAGDLALQTVALRLQAAVRKTDTIARQGGDEFAVLLNGTSKADAERVAGTILQALTAPITFAGNEFSVGGSIGIAAIMPGPPLQARQVMSRADAAMYEAKRTSSGFATAPV